MDIFLAIVMLTVCPFLLSISIKRLKHDTRNMELFEEGWELLQTAPLFITEEQREELAYRVYVLSKSRRYAILDTASIIINLVGLLSFGYFVLGRIL